MGIGSIVVLAVITAWGIAYMYSKYKGYIRGCGGKCSSCSCGCSGSCSKKE